MKTSKKLFLVNFFLKIYVKIQKNVLIVAPVGLCEQKVGAEHPRLVVLFRQCSGYAYIFLRNGLNWLSSARICQVSRAIHFDSIKVPPDFSKGFEFGEKVVSRNLQKHLFSILNGL